MIGIEFLRTKNVDGLEFLDFQNKSFASTLTNLFNEHIIDVLGRKQLSATVEQELYKILNDYTENQKELLKNEIEFIINYIDFYNNLNKESKSKEEILNSRMGIKAYFAKEKSLLRGRIQGETTYHS